MRIDVNEPGFTSPSDQLKYAASDLHATRETLSKILSGTGGMAGSDTGGLKWAHEYDIAAGAAVQAIEDRAAGMNSLGVLLTASLANHRAAEAASAMKAPPKETPFPADPQAGHGTVRPPGAAGAPEDAPEWFGQLVSHLQGVIWPNGDTGRLRTAGNAWRQASNAVSIRAGAPRAASEQLNAIRSPEVPTAQGLMAKAADAAGELASVCREIGDSCHAYADQIDKAHDDLWDLAKDFVRDTVIIELVGAVLVPFTVGVSEAIAQAAETSRGAAALAGMITRIARFVQAVNAVAGKVTAAAGKITGISKVMSRLADVRLVKAVMTMNAKVGVLSADAGREAAARLLGVDAAEAAAKAAWERILPTIPEHILKEPHIPTEGPNVELYRFYKPYGGMTKEQFYAKYWDPETKWWKYPPNNGFLGDPIPAQAKPGEIIHRFGESKGSYAAPDGEQFRARSIPPSSVEYQPHRYKVLKPLDGVQEGTVAPWFDQPGQGKQYYFKDHDIDWYVKNGYLEEIK